MKGLAQRRAAEPPGSAPLHYRLLTAAGPAAIAVIRVRGAEAGAFLSRHVRLAAPESLSVGDVRRGALLDDVGEPIDDVLVSAHRIGSVPEFRLHLHGSPWIVRRLVELLDELGGVNETPTSAARATEPTDSNRSDEPSALWNATSGVAAEAYELLPRMTTLAGARWLLGQPKLWSEWLARLADVRDASRISNELDDVLGRAAWVDWFISPIRIVIAGPPNAGKSTLINALADRPVSIVSDTPGTTRDWVEASGDLGGYPVSWIDTAGLRVAGDELEAAGIERTVRLVAEADAVVLVLDRSAADRSVERRLVDAYRDLRPRLVVLNKCDLPAGAPPELPPEWSASRIVELCAQERIGFDQFEQALLAALGRPATESLHQVAPFSAGQVAAIRRARGLGAISALRDIYA